MAYNPNPTRVWSRVQNQCTYILPNTTYDKVYVPLTGQTLTQEEANYQNKLFYKGNILQYKNNSQKLSKKMKYSQIAKGFHSSRKKTFATQSQTYTSPNNSGLLNVNYVEYPFPNQIVGAPNNISGPFQYNVINPYGCNSNSVRSGGNLICGTYANQCTNEIIKQPSTQSTLCNPSSASDVPGNSILCWNSKISTLFPRQKYIMSNSGTKWPQGYKGFVSAVDISNCNLLS